MQNDRTKRDLENRKHLFHVIDKRGRAMPPGFTTASRAVEYANRLFPDQKQDPDRSGAGWDIEEIPIEAVN